jgi:hypothetical protein
MRHLRLLLVAALVVAAPAAASAREFEVSGGSAMHILRSPSLDASATGDVVALGDLGVAVELLRHVPILDRVSVEGRWSIGSTHAYDFGLYDSELRLQHLVLGVKGAREVLPRVRLFVHADLGASHGSVRIAQTWGGAGAITDGAWASSFYGGGGVDLTLLQASPTGSHPDLALGFRLELGWQETGALSFTASPEGPGDGTATIDTIGAPLGTVDADGLVVRVGLVGRF